MFLGEIDLSTGMDKRKEPDVSIGCSLGSIQRKDSAGLVSPKSEGVVEEAGRDTMKEVRRADGNALSNKLQGR